MFQTQITIAACTVFPLFSIGQVEMENLSLFSPGDKIALDLKIGYNYMVVLKKSRILPKPRGVFQTRRKCVFAYQIGNKGASQSPSECVFLSVN